MNHKIIVTAICLLLSVGAFCQEQNCYVKTLGRPNAPGKALPSVTVRVAGVHNALLSDRRGRFSFIMDDAGNDGSFALGFALMMVLDVVMG